VGVALLGGAALRLLRLGALGFNSDEAVYAGQAASLAGNPLYVDQFPVFRAHPMLIHTMLSPLFAVGEHDVVGRVAVAAFGIATVLAVWLLARRLYGVEVGAVAALILALMPYHVVVTRQVLLDGPMVLFGTLTLYALVRFVERGRALTFIIAAVLMGLTMLAKEPSVVLLAGVYAFFALSPEIKRTVRLSLVGLLTIVAVFAAHPVSQNLAGHSSAGKGYLIWQLLRRPNHEWTFYATVVPPAMGGLVLLAAGLGLLYSRVPGGWRERLLVCWIVAPIVAFQLWPVKGFQYLLPVAPAIATLAARGLLTVDIPRRWTTRWTRRWQEEPARSRMAARLRVGAVAMVALSLALPSWQLVNATSSSTFLAGTGGVPGGREAGRWLAANTPEGSVVLTLGPSMSNIIKYYAHRESYGLSVSSNPLHRNPAYVPITNPDQALRNNEINYIVWDAFSAGRSPFFSERLLTLGRRYHGRVVHTEYVQSKGSDGVPQRTAVITVYEVRP
jgi:4-amino-4-deoxy-L-arabinose transferase-like glycosyltransferase